MAALKEDVYLIEHRVSRAITHVKPDPQLAGLYTITNSEEPDDSLTYDTDVKLFVGNPYNKWTLDVRGSQFV